MGIGLCHKFSDVKKVSYLQDVYGEVDTQLLWLVFEELIELVVEVGADGHVGEHPVQFACVLIPTCLLQNHNSSIIACVKIFHNSHRIFTDA